MTVETAESLPTIEDIEGVAARIRGGELQQGISQLEAWIALVRAAGDSLTLARVHGALATGYQYAGRNKDSLQTYHAAIQLLEQIPGAEEELAKALSMAAITLVRLGEPSEALHLVTRALDVVPACQPSAGAFCVWNNLGVVYESLKDFPQAISTTERALALAERLGRADMVAYSASNVMLYRLGYGLELEQQTRHAEAVQQIEPALAAFAGHARRYGWDGNDRLAPTLAIAASDAYLVLGDARAARVAAEIGLEAARRADLQREQAQLWLNLVAVERAENDLAAALRHAQAALQLVQEMGEPELLARCHLEASRLHEAAGAFRDALHHHQQYHAQREALLRALSDSRSQALSIRLGNEVARLEAELLRLRTAELEDDCRHLASEALQLVRAANEDSLTGLGNRRYFESRLHELRDGCPTLPPMAVAIADVDHFKRINDGYSHAVGDAVLQRIGALFRQHCRPQDVVARFGGEEFVIAFAGIPPEQALRASERLRAAIQTYDWGTVAPGLAVTISIGLAEFPADIPFEQALAEADRALYVAKNSGRNRVSLA
jgi:diguanylate cyclase (GGDEF)-like protein